MLGQRVARLSTLPFFKFMLGQRVARLSTLAFFFNLCWVNELLDYPHCLFFKLMLGQWVARLSTLAFLLIYVGSTSW